MRNKLILIAIPLAVILVFLAGFHILSSKLPQIPITDVVTLSEQHQIKSIEVNGDTLTITRLDNSQVISNKESSASLYEITGLDLAGVTVDVATSSGINWGLFLISFLIMLPVGTLLYFIFRSIKNTMNQNMRFGRSRARLFVGDKSTVTFQDVAGVEEAKQELCEVVEFLKEREKFQSLGARVPKGVLLVGPPGTGKTLLARAVAGEAGVPFFSISGSEFVEFFVGVGASRVRDLFQQAKQSAPCIVFIDEIDAVGRHRGAGRGAGNDEREQTLNQILVEMDGFDTNTSVIVLAATNRPDVLDPALLRPGRFDRRVTLDAPDIQGRLAILKVHARGKPLANAAELEAIAKATPGFSGADLANLINESAILAARRGKKAIEMSELGESIDRVIAGPERKSRRIGPKDKAMTAYHEAGHAMVAKMLPGADQVDKISIIARGHMGGYTRQLPAEDRYTATKTEFKANLAVLMGGRVAEELIFNELATGAANDMQRATNLSRKMVTSFGMSEILGPRTFGQQEDASQGHEVGERDYSEKTALIIDSEVNKLIDEAHNTASKILAKNKKILVHLADTLIAVETLEGEALERVFAGGTPALPVRDTVPSVTPATAPSSPGRGLVSAPQVNAHPSLLPN